jgi:hypothetical protein
LVCSSSCHPIAAAVSKVHKPGSFFNLAHPWAWVLPRAYLSQNHSVSRVWYSQFCTKFESFEWKYQSVTCGFDIMQWTQAECVISSVWWGPAGARRAPEQGV